jgi:hypothetical protein
MENTNGKILGDQVIHRSTWDTETTIEDAQGANSTNLEMPLLYKSTA